jgi:nucleotide-binding universal stress UspA family protein
MPNSEPVYVVPLSGSPATAEALLVAGEMARARHGAVLATYVIEVSYELPLDAEMDADSRRGETVLRRAEQTASERHFKLDSNLLQARSAGRAIADEARRVNAVAIVIGVGARSDGTFDAGRTADYLLRKAPCPVWMIREKVPAQ